MKMSNVAKHFTGEAPVMLRSYKLPPNGNVHQRVSIFQFLQLPSKALNIREILPNKPPFHNMNVAESMYETSQLAILESQSAQAHWDM